MKIKTKKQLNLPQLIEWEEEQKKHNDSLTKDPDNFNIIEEED